MDNLITQRIKAALFIFILLFSLPSLSLAETLAGRVISATPKKVTAINQEGAERILKRRAKFFLGDTIVTGAEAKAQLRFTDGSIVSLREQTTYEITQYAFDDKSEEGKHVTRLIKGGIKAITGRIAKHNAPDHEVVTAVATIGVRGTTLEVVYTDKLYVAVWQGKIIVVNSKGELLLGDGQSYRFAEVRDADAAPIGLLNSPGALLQNFVPGVRPFSTNITSRSARDEQAPTDTQGSTDKEGSQGDSGDTTSNDGGTPPSGNQGDRGSSGTSQPNSDQQNTGTTGSGTRGQGPSGGTGGQEGQSNIDLPELTGDGDGKSTDLTGTATTVITDGVGIRESSPGDAIDLLPLDEYDPSLEALPQTQPEFRIENEIIDPVVEPKPQFNGFSLSEEELNSLSQRALIASNQTSFSPYVDASANSDARPLFRIVNASGDIEQTILRAGDVVATSVISPLSGIRLGAWEATEQAPAKYYWNPDQPTQPVDLTQPVYWLTFDEASYSIESVNSLTGKIDFNDFTVFAADQDGRIVSSDISISMDFAATTNQGFAEMSLLSQTGNSWQLSMNGQFIALANNAPDRIRFSVIEESSSYNNDTPVSGGMDSMVLNQGQNIVGNLAVSDTTDGSIYLTGVLVGTSSTQPTTAIQVGPDGILLSTGQPNNLFADLQPFTPLRSDSTAQQTVIPLPEIGASYGYWRDSLAAANDAPMQQFWLQGNAATELELNNLGTYTYSNVQHIAAQTENGLVNNVNASTQIQVDFGHGSHVASGSMSLGLTDNGQTESWNVQFLSQQAQGNTIRLEADSSISHLITPTSNTPVNGELQGAFFNDHNKTAGTLGAGFQFQSGNDRVEGVIITQDDD
jgi:hypothetical protein